jgi:redox-sensing transcriptional repressor
MGGFCASPVEGRFTMSRNRPVRDLNRPQIERLMRYYLYLCDLSCPLAMEIPVCPLTAGNGIRTVTSAQIAKAMERDHTLVRKDFAAVGIQGQPRVGFDSVEICRAIRYSLGLDQGLAAILVGAGHLGYALLGYPSFGRYGLRIEAAFDSDRRKVGSTVGGCAIKPLGALRPYVRRHGIKVALLTTPGKEAQRLADELVSAGIRAIWNFTPAKLRVERPAFVRNEQISLGISELAYRLNVLRGKPRREKPPRGRRKSSPARPKTDGKG